MCTPDWALDAHSGTVAHPPPPTPGNQNAGAERRTNMNPRHLVIAISLALLPSACGREVNEADDDSPTSPWGPLAVVPGPPSGMEAVTAGHLDVTERCVTLRHAGSAKEVLVIWPSEATTWNPSSSTIGYTHRGRAFELSHGDELDVGGGGSSSTEGGPGSDEFVASIDNWVSEPDPSCVTDERWFVGDIGPKDETSG